MSPPLGILHALNKNRLSTGSVVQMMEAARGQRKRGHDVWVAAPPGGDLENACREFQLRFLPFPFRHEVDVTTISGLRRHIRRGCDIVHVHKGLPHTLALLAALGLGWTPRLVVNRGVSFRLDLFNRWKYRHPRVGAVVCVAEAVREVVVAGGGARRERTRVIHAGTDIVRFDPAGHKGGASRTELGLTANDLLIGAVSVRDWKGWRELLAAFSEMVERGTDAKLLLVGCEPESERQKVEETAALSGVTESVFTLPFRDDMPDVLGACDIVVDASWAGTGITGTIREAMALAKAVVATDVGGNAELIDDAEVGRLIPARDVGALVQTLTELAANPELRTRLGEAARHRVVHDFSTEKRVDRLLKLYHELVSDQPGPGTLATRNTSKGA